MIFSVFNKFYKEQCHFRNEIFFLFEKQHIVFVFDFVWFFLILCKLIWDWGRNRFLPIAVCLLCKQKTIYISVCLWDLGCFNYMWYLCPVVSQLTFIFHYPYGQQKQSKTKNNTFLISGIYTEVHDLLLIVLIHNLLELGFPLEAYVQNCLFGNLLWFVFYF